MFSTKKYEITYEITKYLIPIEEIKETMKTLPINAKMIATLKNGKLMTNHCSAVIDVNLITGEEAERFIKTNPKSKERDELEIISYCNALEYVQDIISEGGIIIPFVSHEQKMLDPIVISMKNALLLCIASVESLLCNKSHNLESWHTLEFVGLAQELSKQKVSLSSIHEFDLKNLFGSEKKVRVWICRPKLRT